MIDLSLLTVAGVVVSRASATNRYVDLARGTFAALGCEVEVFGCDCCDDAEDFTDPATDEAPWYSAADPASAEYLGMVLLGVDGLDNVLADRTVTDSPIRGGIAGRLHEGARTVSFRGRLFATSQRGMEYGRRWLAWVLSRADCEPCSTERDAQAEASWYAWCPTVDERPDALRVLVGVKLSAGPTFSLVDADDADCGRYMQEVAFGLTSPSPYLFGAEGSQDPCLDGIDPYDGTADNRWGSGAAASSTRAVATSAVADGGAAGAAIFGLTPGSFYDGTGDTGGDIDAGGTWTDPDGAPGYVVIAHTLTLPGSPDYTLIRRLTVSVAVEYASSPHVTPWDFALGIAAADGALIAGFAQGAQVAAPPINAGGWRGNVDQPQTFAYTIVGAWTPTEVEAMLVAYVARSRTVARVAASPDDEPDSLTVVSVDVLAEGYAGDGTKCACSWCRDFCRHPYQCCVAVPPIASDAVPIVHIVSDDGSDLHVEVVQGLALDGAGIPVGCESASDLWRCDDDPCARFNVRGEGELWLDGRLRLSFPPEAAQGDGQLPFRWPDACCGPLCICVAAHGIDGDPVAATVDVTWVRRYLV